MQTKRVWKNKFEYSPLGMSLSKSFEKENVKNIASLARKSEFTKDIMNLKRCH